MRKRILIVDDDEMSRALLKHYLHPNYTLDFAENGTSAVIKTRKKEYDLILMDIHMPGLNGYQTSYFLRTKINTPIIGISGEGESDITATFSGMSEVISKDLSRCKIIDKIEKAINKVLV